ncbi:ABC transporter substrate-binding protein [Patulibacter defluvii]|uniref:ABC transporter substrate-binding protein n=1 Tax=Patulibacter defluvii TaxID=3095358 RepID=UPI002A762D30|nr:ABC transporter substrate-binding protein [Patulibacter sp. DM4]
MLQRPTVRGLAAALATVGLLALAGCGDDDPSATAAAATTGAIEVRNCGVERRYRGPVRRIVATSNSANVGTLIRVGAARQIAAMSLSPGNDPVMERYGASVASIPRLQSPIALEAVVARRPDLLIGSYSGLFAGASGVTEERARARRIATYVISDSCRQDPAKGRDSALGTMGPWDAVRADLANYGALTGHRERAADARRELDRRLAALRAAPRPRRAPRVLLYDSGEKDLYTSGRNGAPQGIIDAAGGRNVFADVDTTWFRASWERVARARPDLIVVMDYRSGEPGEVRQKLATIRARAGLRGTPVVDRDRIVVLPLSLFTSGFPNIDAAEQVRAALEAEGLAPPSAIGAKRIDWSALGR